MDLKQILYFIFMVLVGLGIGWVIKKISPTPKIRVVVCIIVIVIIIGFKKFL